MKQRHALAHAATNAARPSPGASRARTAAAVCMALLASPAGADVFSPGPLAKAHAALEGLSNCTKCHEAGKQLTAAICLACHTELRGRVAGGRGLHGRLAGHACEECHHDHQGRDAPLVDWGPAGKSKFDHARTGTPLRGKHAGAACEKCHEQRRIVDADIRTLVSKTHRETYLGMAGTCAGCHFDEHRGQIGTDCQRCHGESAWKPAAGFQHARARYPLEGKHAAVACAKCHPSKEDPAGPQAFPAAVAAKFAVFRPVPFASCQDCHKDPHAGRFGPACASCHAATSWKDLRGGAKERAFHEKTKYPLRGAHAAVACGACHGPWPGVPAKYRGMAFGTCGDCHADAHAGQITKIAACDRCHTLESFATVRYEVEDHARTRYPLEGAHRAVACVRCHPRSPDLPRTLSVVAVQLPGKAPTPPRFVQAKLERPPPASPAVFWMPPAPERCEACHQDPHSGQFAQRSEKQGCAACHLVAAFSQLRFDHGKDTRFPLAGKHAKAGCAACHRREARIAAVRYRPLETTCAGCHADPHAGQFMNGKGTNDCARCHGEDAWKTTRFKHEPPFTQYRLEGKHALLACEKCHRSVAVAGAGAVRRYRPLPTACEGCHADFHKGAFREFVP